MGNWKEDVVEVYLETSFKECVMYCTDEKIISSEKEKEVMLNYNQNEDQEHEVVNNFFDYIGIDEDTFLEISNKLESNG